MTGDTKKLFIDQEESLHRTKVKIIIQYQGRPDSYVENYPRQPATRPSGFIE
jgi:hypothetical protein